MRAVRAAAGHPSQPSGHAAADPRIRRRQHRRRRALARRFRHDRTTLPATDGAPKPRISPAGNPIGFGRMHRKEDARFLRGQGNYVDDVTMPGMLHSAILRSPYAHARIRSIDTVGGRGAARGARGDHRRRPSPD